jgi:outer membrane receptor protein involved in Fe transport
MSVRATLLAVATTLPLVAHAIADTAKRVDVPAGDLSSALLSLSRQTGTDLVYPPEQIHGLTTEGVHGELTAEQAVIELLKGTPLEPTVDRTGAIFIAAPRPASGSREKRGERASHGEEGQKDKSFWSWFRVAQADSGRAVGALGAAAEKSAARVELEEIVVTAQKRAERLIDVPQSVSVLSADELTKLGATQFRDFANTVPGLSFTTSGAGYTQVSLRGVTAGTDIGPTVAIYVDDVPYGSSSTFAYASALALDVGLFDLDHIEVLRGPQGTLYGASTMGGLIKYVSRPPDTATLDGNLQTGISDAAHGGVSYNVSGAVNVPIATDTAAVRASGFYSRDGGFIDNIATDQTRIDRAKTYGGRLDLLLTASGPLTVRLTGFAQNLSRGGEGTVDYGLNGAPLNGRFDQDRQFAEPFEQQFRLASGTLTYDFGPATLTSISSYQSAHSDFLFDLSRTFAPLLNSIGLGPYGALGNVVRADTDKVTQELRVAPGGGGVLEWLIGAFYTRETSNVLGSFSLRDPAGQPLPNTLFTFASPSRFEEYALFGDLTWHVSSKVDLTGGVRGARNRQRFEQIGSGLFGLNTPTRRSNEDVQTYLANARYHFNEHATAYFRFATGYRPGGPNFATIDAVTGQPLGADTFEADRLESYEVGFKAETADRRWGAEIAAYAIDWDNIQLAVSRGSFSGNANAPGGASISGVELSCVARPGTAFSAAAAFAYQHAYLNEANADLRASAGERLPNVPRMTGTLSSDYRLPFGTLRPTIGATVRYVSNRWASFDQSLSSPQYRLPAYTAVSVRAGFELQRTTVQLYVNNLFDERGELSAFTNRGPPHVALLAPRTIGVLATLNF